MMMIVFVFLAPVLPPIPTILAIDHVERESTYGTISYLVPYAACLNTEKENYNDKSKYQIARAGND